MHDGDELLAVTVYKRGAQEVTKRLQALDRQLAAQQALIASLTPANENGVPRAAEAAPPEFQERVSRPTEQLPLFSLPDRPACRRRRFSDGQSLSS